MNEPLAVLTQAQTTAITLAIQFGPKLLVAILILGVGHYVARWLGRMSQRLFTSLDLDPTTIQLLERTVRYLVLGLFLVMALQNLGIELLPLLAGLGIAGAGAALAMQGVLSNLAAGLTIIFTRPFRVGDYISIADEEGQVETITLFSTTLGHPDLSRVIIPNRKIAGEILHNYGGIRQLNVQVGVAYGTDMAFAIARIEALLAANPKVLTDPAPLIQVITLADSSVSIAVRPWVKVPDYPIAIGEVNQAILEDYRARGIVIPYPQREVRLLSGNA
jgi:small conductance mechanosensitive channel